MRAEQAWFLFKGERKPEWERDSSLGNRTGDEPLALSLLITLIKITARKMFKSLFLKKTCLSLKQNE